MRKDNYHITIKNLSTGKEEGFMLASGDAPYQIQGIDNVAQRVADGEILYSDFTNSRVFAQSDWSEWVSKYWDPERIYSVIYPSKKYKDKKNIEIKQWEFTLGGNVAEEYTIPFTTGEWPMCKGETAGVVYLGSGMQLYRSTDFGNTWSLWKDFSTVAQLSDVNEITDITITDTEPLTRSHGASMGSITISNVQALFVAFYNRTTKVSGIARYDINFTLRSATGSTFKNGWSWSVASAYGSKRDSITVNTSGLTTSSFQAYKVNNSQEFTLPATWNSLGLFPGQRIKLTRNNTGVVYNMTVAFVGWAFGTSQAIWLVGMPNYDSVTDANNYYTVTEVGKNSSSICLPLSSGGIESYTYVGLGLGQNVIYNGITYTISGLGNGLDYFGNIPWYFPGTSPGTADYIMLTRIDGGDAWTGIFGNWSQTLNTEKWIYKYGTYNNKITKFVNCEKEITHIWGYNHIDPVNKFYDVAYGELTTNALYSLIYSNSLNGVLHSAQNHTITFNSWDCPTSAAPVGYAEWLPSWSAPVLYVGTQFGSDGLGTQASLFKFTLDDTNQTAATYTIKWSVGAVALTSMVYFMSKLYIGSKKRGMVYEWDNSNSTLTELAQLPRDDTTEQAVIDMMTTFAGKIVCSYQKGSGIYTLDPNTRQNASPLIETDVLCSVDTLSNARIYRICNTGGLLLFTDGLKIYSYDQDWVAAQGYMESSIYGWYISNVDKQWVYAYVRLGKWTLDAGQRVAMQVSLDEGVTWNYCPTSANKQFSATNAWDDDYSIGYTNIEDKRKQQAVFYFPYYSLSGTIIYRCWLKKGTTVKPYVNHIGVHYYLNYKQELLFNYQLDLNKSVELLGGRTVEKDLQFSKLQFLKDIWNNQYQVEVTDVTGIKYTCVPYSDDRTPGQWLIIATSNNNTAHIDQDNLTFKVSFSLKTIANYQKTI